MSCHLTFILTFKFVNIASISSRNVASFHENLSIYEQLRSSFVKNLVCHCFLHKNPEYVLYTPNVLFYKLFTKE